MHKKTSARRHPLPSSWRYLILRLLISFALWRYYSTFFKIKGYCKYQSCFNYFIWHHHESVDELFWVIKGQLIIHFRDRKIIIKEGEFVIVPKKLEHKPEAPVETHIVLIEIKGTVNTGNIKSKLTRKKLIEI